MKRTVMLLCGLLALGAASAAAQGRMRPFPRPHAGWYGFYGRPHVRGYARFYGPMMWRRYRYRAFARPGFRRWGPAYGWRGYRRGRRNAI